MKVDLLLKNGWVYRTYRRCFEQADIAVTGERVYDISPVAHYEAETVIDCTGKYVIPGLIDIHMHVESSMTYPEEYSRLALANGVTTVVADPHEIANVFGMEGIQCFMEQETELDLFYGIPSCVPATNPGMETSGGIIGETEVAKLLQDQRMICLGEVMNFKDLVSEEDTLIKRIIRLCRECGREIRLEGHCPGLTGSDCARFIYEGADADHTQQTGQSVLQKTDMGMFLELQAKSLTEEVVETVSQYGLYDNIALVTDDTMPDHLVYEGALNRIVRIAVKMGMPAEQAIYCSTLTPARRMHLDDRGILAPGKLADFLILSDLSGFVPEAVYKNGKKCKQEQTFRQTLFPKHFYHSVQCRPACESDFVLRASADGTAIANVMQIQDFGTTVKLVKREIEVKDGTVMWQEAGLCLAAVFERYNRSGQVSLGLVEHAFSSRGAVATTWSHDSHNLLVLGNSPKDMAVAQREILRLQGGYTVVSSGAVIAGAELSIGGILSDKPLEILAQEISGVRNAVEVLGYQNNNVIMSISTLTLLASPEVKLSDKGLFHVKTQEKIPLIESYRKGN